MVGTENVEARGPCPSPALRRGVPREGRGHTCLAPAYVGLSALASGRSDRMFLGPEVPRVSGATDKTSQHRGSAGTAAAPAWRVATEVQMPVCGSWCLVSRWRLQGHVTEQSFGLERHDSSSSSSEFLFSTELLPRLPPVGPAGEERPAAGVPQRPTAICVV